MNKITISLIVLLSLNTQAKTSKADRDEMTCELGYETLQSTVKLLKDNPKLKLKDFEKMKFVTDLKKTYSLEQRPKIAPTVFTEAKRIISNNEKIDYESRKAKCMIKYSEWD